MKTDWKISYFKPDRQGVYPSKDSVSFAACLLTDKECGVILYDSRGRQRRFPFKEVGKRGALHGLRIEGKGSTIILTTIMWMTRLSQTLMQGK